MKDKGEGSEPGARQGRKDSPQKGNKWKKAPPELIERFLMTTEPIAQLQPRKMFGYPCTFLNGNMCTGLAEENWIVRLSEEDRAAMTEAYGAVQFAPNGRKMREYMVLPEEVLEDQELVEEWIGRSIQFVSSLPPRGRVSDLRNAPT